MKRLRSLLIGLLCLVASSAFAQLTIGTVDPGPYTPGSTLAATFTIGNTSCIAIGNTFELYLSDASGNFGAETRIGTYNGFYSTFVNGLIPAGITPGTGYKVRVKSTTPALVSNESAAFEIKAGTAVEAKLSSLPINSTTQDAFGSCAGRDNFNYAFTNESTATSAVTATIKNELTGAAATNLTFSTPIQTYNASLAHFTVFTKAVMPDGTVGTKAYFLINNQTVTAFSTSGNNVVCLPNSQLEFGVDISTDGILKNFPGDTYVVNWGDQTTSTYTLCDIRQNAGKIRHTYTQSSCGNVFSGSSGTEYNVFAVTISVENPYCGRVGSTISSTAKVITKPVNTFTTPLTACTNTNVTFVNTSIQGEDPNTNSPGCRPNTVTYNWFVDGVLVAANKPITFDLVWPFTTHGTHTIRLESTSSGTCDADPYSTTICIQDPPQPGFNLSANPICQGSTVTLTNTSVVDNICGNNTTYAWSVSPATGFVFAGGTNASSPNPQITFNTIGLYTITLAVTSGTCTTVTTSKQLAVNTAPTATLAADAQLCGTNTYTFDDTPGSITRTTFTGTVQEPISTYTWTVVADNGGTWSFVNGTNANSKYPQIKFDNFDTYTITVTHTNNCSTASDSQKLTFNTAPIVNAGPDQAICYNDASFTLAASITGTTTNQAWTGGNGIFTPNRNTLNATYTPTAAEKIAGTVTLTLTGTTTLPAPCNSVADQVVLTIKPRITINSATSKSICTGDAVAYSPTSNMGVGTTYSWTASGTPNAGGFNTGNGATINDVLTNSSPTANASVTYTITPTFDGCPGDPFTFTVTVTPRPVLTATPANAIICSGQGTAISLSSNLAGTKYTWTSTAQAGITGNTNQATQITATSINNTLTNSLTTAATVDYVITPYSAAGCAGTPVTVTITVAPTPSTPNAGADESICNAGSYVLQGNQPLVGTGKWTLVSSQTGVTFVDDTQYNTTANGLVAGQTYIFRWTISGAATCTPKTDDVSITVNPPSVGGTTAGGKAVCSDCNTGQITLSGQVGAVLRWERSIDGGTTWLPISNTTATLTYTNLTATTQYRAVVKNGACPPDNSSISTITVNPAVVPANAGTDITQCNVTSVTLAGNSPLTNTGKWTVSSGQTVVVFADDTQFNTQVSGLVPGQTYVFTWTISGLAPCTPSSDDVTVKIDLPSDGGTTAGSKSVCSDGNTGQITLTGQVGSVLRWERSVDGGNTWITVANTTAILNFTNLTATTQYRAVVQNGSCGPATSTVATITVNPAVVASNAGANQELCNQTTATLAGNSPLTNTGKWTQKSGPAGAVFADDTQFNTQVSGLVPGSTYVFTWTISGLAPCPPSASDVQIIINAPSDGGITAGSATVCSGSNNGSITLSGQTGGIIRWESSTDGGTTWAPIANTTTSVAYNNLTVTTQYRAVVKNGNCAAANSAISTITVNPLSITSNAGPDQELCDQTSATLAGNSPQAQTGLWTQTGGPAGAVFADATLYNTQVSGLIPGNTYTFTWTISGLAPCPPSASSVRIVINAPSNGGLTAGNATVCSGSSSGNITLSGQVGNIIRWESSTDGGTTWTPISNTTTSVTYNNLTATTQYRAVVKNGNCAPANSTVSTITVNPVSITSVAGSNQELCDQTSATLAGNSPLTQTGLWTQTGGPAGAVFADATLYNTQVTGLIPGNTYTFTWTISGLAPCPPSSSSMTVKVNEASNGGTTAGSAAVCSGSGSGNITLSGQVGIIQGWERSTDGGTTWTPISNTTNSVAYSNLTTTTQYRAVVKNGNCPSAYSTVSTITVNPGSIATIAGPNQELCDQTSATLAGNSPLTQTGLWTQTGGPAGAVFADATLYNTQVSGLIPGNTYTFTWTISGLAPCPPSSSSMTVKVNEASNGGTTAGSTAVCSGSGSGNITLSGQIGAIQGWEQSTDGGTTWTPISNTTNSVAYTNLTITTQYRAIVKNGNCPSAYSTVATITVNPGSITSVAGPNQELCDQISATLAGNSPLTQTGLWTQTGGPAGAVFADATLYNTQVTGLIPGNTYTFTWTISGLAPCPPSSSSVTIIVNAASNGGTLAGSTAVCSGGNNGTLTLSAQVGAIQGWERSIDGGTTWTPIGNTTNSLTYSNLTTTTQYRVIVKNGNCAPAFSTVATITVNQAVVQATAGPDQTLCNTPSITLQGNSPLANTGLWTLTSGQSGVTFADATQYNTQVSGLVGGETYTFRWTISGLAPCPPTSDEVTMTNLAPLTNTNITTPFLIACNGQVITLSGNVPTGGNGTYTYVWESSSNGGTTWATISGQTGPSLNITVNASLSYRRTVTSGSCSAISNVLQITALPAIANNSISATHSICFGSTATPITGSQPTGGDGTNYTYGWEQSTDNGTTWTAIIGANARDYAPGAITQTTSYRRLVSSGACAGSLQSISNVVKVTVNPNAKAEFTFTRDLDCFPFIINGTNIRAVAYPDRNAIYTWYADNVAIGTGINFPGYTIATENTAVVIKLVVTSSLGCSQDEMSHTFRTRPNILATFTPSAVNGCGPLTVDFTNTSNTLTGVTFEWRVNNVVVGTSADLRRAFDADPFGEDKEYIVTLTVIGPCGRSVSAPQKITVYGTPIATGTPDKTRGCSPLTVNFRNTSPGSTNTYTYEIDGVVVNGPSNSKADFPYTFTTDVVREYKVKVTAINSCGTDSREYVIVVSPNTIRPGFTVDGNKLRGCAPFDVDFINSTVGASQYVYNFEPGQSAEISVTNRPEVKHHRFEKAGTYVVTMLATNDCSTAPVQTVTIIVDPQPVAAFSANLTIGCTGFEVKFTNTSKDAIGYVWDFGDGSPTSTAVSPTHVYKGNPQNFTVTLTAINSLGCPTTETKTDYIRLVGPPKADFSISPAAVISIPNYSFKFTNESTNGAQTYKWTFGDGDASTVKDPAHTYLDTGRFLVTLRTYNEQGCVDSIQKYVHIVGVPGYVYLPNSFMPGGTSVQLQKFIAVGAGIKSWKMSVFNKWGQVLWETTKLDDGKPIEGWDGTYNGVAQPQGIYFWKMEVELINGTEWKGVTLDKSAPKRTGEIYLIR